MGLVVGVANVVQLVKSDKKNNAKNLRHCKIKIYAMKSVARFSTEYLICQVSKKPLHSLSQQIWKVNLRLY